MTLWRRWHAGFVKAVRFGDQSVHPREMTVRIVVAYLFLAAGAVGSIVRTGLVHDVAERVVLWSLLNFFITVPLLSRAFQAKSEYRRAMNETARILAIEDQDERVQAWVAYFRSRQVSSYKSPYNLRDEEMEK